MKGKMRGVIVAGTAFALMAVSGPAQAGKIQKSYNSIPSHVPGNVSSLGFEATTTAEFGDEVLLNAANRHLTRVRVVMSSWGCESGAWFSNDCLTSTGATFTMQITLNIYVGNGATTNGDTPGPLLASQTRTFNVRYRPSLNSVKCTGADAGKWFSKTDQSCYNGFAQSIQFAFPAKSAAAKIQLPQDVVWSIAYNTTHYGYAPAGESAPCYTSSGGCGYDSLNVGAESFTGRPNPGTDFDPAGVFVNYAQANQYCDGGTGGFGVLRLDTDPGSCGWTGFTPLAMIKTT
jgi:hypothetical protein